MPHLIAQLKQEHVAISDVFLEIVLLDINTEQGRHKLLEAQAALLTHLKQEDEEFYPVLWSMRRHSDSGPCPLIFCSLNGGNHS